MKATAQVVCILALSVALVAQSAPPAYVVHGSCDDGLPHFAEWFQTTKLSSGQPYVASTNRRQQIVQSYSKLKLEMTVDEVEQVLGKPDFSSPRAKGHLSNEPAPATPVCSDQLAYILKKTGENMADMSDEAIYLFFSSERKLVWAAPQNVSALKPLGGPG